jgi:hypothetical protein
MDVKRDDNDTTIASRQTRGLTCCCHQHVPQLPSGRSKVRDMRRRPSIVFAAVMVAGSNDGLPPRWMEVVMVWWQVALKKVLKGTIHGCFEALCMGWGRC